MIATAEYIETAETTAEDASSSGTARDMLPWLQASDACRALSKLGPDWDGLGAAAPSVKTIQNAIQLLSLLSENGLAAEAPSRISALPSGDVLFEWYTDGEYQEAQINEHQAAFMLERKGAQPLFWNLPNDGNVIGSVGHRDRTTCLIGTVGFSSTTAAA